MSQSLLQTIDLPELRHAGITLTVLRLDLFSDPIVCNAASGNKYFKLKNNFFNAKASGFSTILSFGGVWSNHLHALAIEAHAQGMQSIGVVRGDERSLDTAMLRDVKALGMQIYPVSREEYRRRHDADYWQLLAEQFANPYIVPEGGSNLAGVQGCRDIVALIESLTTEHYDIIALPVGSGGTLAGIASALPDNCKAMGYCVVRDSQLPQRIGSLLDELDESLRDNWQLRDACHTGRYGQCNEQLARFVIDFSAQTGVIIEPTYSGKLFYELMRDIAEGFFPRGSRLMAVHTGGMQGWRGQQSRVLQRVA